MVQSWRYPRLTSVSQAHTTTHTHEVKAQTHFTLHNILPTKFQSGSRGFSFPVFYAMSKLATRDDDVLGRRRSQPRKQGRATVTCSRETGGRSNDTAHDIQPCPTIEVKCRDKVRLVSQLPSSPGGLLAPPSFLPSFRDVAAANAEIWLGRTLRGTLVGVEGRQFPRLSTWEQSTH